MVACTTLVDPLFQEKPQPQEPSPSPSSWVSPPSPSPIAPLVSPMFQSSTSLPIAPERLWADLRSLSFSRFTRADRTQALNYIHRSLQESGWQPRIMPYAEGVNLGAERLGTDPRAGTLLVGAHYDTVDRSPGSNDNASGVAVLLELARLLGDRPTPRTLQLVFFDQEEVGLQGSLAFTQDPKNIQGVRGAIILDMVGFACEAEGCQQYPEGLSIQPPSDRGDFLTIIGDSEHPALLNAFHYQAPQGGADPSPTGLQLARSSRPSFPPVVTLAVPWLGRINFNLLRSDHAPFWLKGIGAVLVTDTGNFRNPHYHQSTDTPDHLHPDFWMGSAQVIVNAIVSLLENPQL